MKAQKNVPCTICKVMMIVAVVAMAVAGVLGCQALKTEGASDAKAQIGTALLIAYENGGREAISNRIEQLVAEGKLSGEQAVRLQALADIACEKLIEDLVRAEGANVTNAVESTDSSGGCTISPPCDAKGDGGNGETGNKENTTSS